MRYVECIFISPVDATPRRETQSFPTERERRSDANMTKTLTNPYIRGVSTDEL